MITQDRNASLFVCVCALVFVLLLTSVSCAKHLSSVVKLSFVFYQGFHLLGCQQNQFVLSHCNVNPSYIKKENPSRNSKNHGKKYISTLKIINYGLWSSRNFCFNLFSVVCFYFFLH